MKSKGKRGKKEIKGRGVGMKEEGIGGKQVKITIKRIWGSEIEVRWDVLNLTMGRVLNILVIILLSVPWLSILG